MTDLNKVVLAEIERRKGADRRATTSTQIVDSQQLTAALAKLDELAHVESQIAGLLQWRDALDRRWFVDDLNVKKRETELVDLMKKLQDHVNDVIRSMNKAVADCEAATVQVRKLTAKVEGFERGRAKWIGRMKAAAWATGVTGAVAGAAIAKFVFHLG